MNTIKQLIERQPLLLDVPLDEFVKKAEMFLNIEFTKELKKEKKVVRNCGSCDKYERGCQGNAFNICEGWIEKL